MIVKKGRVDGARLLREELSRPGIVLVPGVFNALTALMWGSRWVFLKMNEKGFKHCLLSFLRCLQRRRRRRRGSRGGLRQL